MSDQIPVARPTVDDEMVERAAAALRSGRHVKGPRVEGFESEFADFCGVEHAVAVSSGTSALFLALRAAGVGEGDAVAVPGHTFFASVSPVLSLGAEPVFVDVDPETYTMDPDALAAAAETASDDLAAVLPVHLYGQPAEVGRIRDVADEHGAAVVEDACQAHGAAIDGERAGSLGDVGCFSFYPTKNMTVAGDGGMLVTDDADLAATARHLRNHGRDDSGDHVALGLNHRMDEPRAAVGREQLDRLPAWNDRRQEIAAIYRERLGDVDGVTLPDEREGVEHVYHLFVVQVDDREALRESLAERGVDTAVHYETPAHRHESVRSHVDAVPTLPETEALVDRIVSLPMFPGLDDEDVERVCAAIRDHYAEPSAEVRR
ncbi:DegT/DnrJ/EryC1/StrS family aminotransferase [Halospeciosus flavus]|uniref:DegT/DnrJ/EryC1/StrS family aminotransferase n=1 Tax=Halospeciosus flavus TaxID=3032283 RepID=A0ABD5Z0X7_9EURY|nr:DegT/DnrJ/EryC1/StrS family aminotransferase [Halospeciosus flavus]